jgi:hypothetical protein
MHFQVSNVIDFPFPNAFQVVQSCLAYFIVETFAIHNKDNILVIPLPISTSYWDANN